MAEGHTGQIGRYTILDELGRGGFGRVYRAYDPTVGRPVAVKVMEQVSEDNRTRFRNEAVVAGNLGHRNIVTVYEFGTHQDLPYLAMEYLEGQDLQQIIASRAPLSLLKKCNIMSEVAEGLQCAHQSGVVHRDMKPGNIMVLRDGAVKIMDFGIARLTSKPDATRLTQQGYLIGTLRYMAPEQLAGCDFDVLCDIFAYGVVFYELLTGRHPFEAPDAQSLMYKLTFEEPPPLRQFAPDIPDALQDVISKIIHKDRARRYQSLKEVQFDTEPIRIDLQRVHLEALLKRAQELTEKEEFEAAQDVVQEALLLDRSNRTARILREDLKQHLQRQAVQPRMDSSLREGEEHLAQRRFPEAVRAFEQALELDPGNSSVHARLEQTRLQAEQVRRASQLLADARKELEERNVTAAYRSVSKALRHDPKNPEAAEFLKTIQAYVEGREAEQRVDEKIRKAQGLMLIPAYDEAIATLASAGQDAESPKIVEFLERVRAQKLAYEQKQKLRRQMAAATDLLRQNELDDAVQCLENLRSEYPDDRDVDQLLSYARREQAALARAKAVEGVAKESRSRAESGDFEGALAALDRALKEYPGDSGLIRLLNNTLASKDAWERQQAIQSILANCESLRSQRRFDEAVKLLEGAVKDYGGEPVLVTLLKDIEAARNEERRNQAVRQACESAERLLRQAQPDAALRELQAALPLHPGDSALGSLLQRAQEAVRAQKRARAVGSIERDVARYAAAHDFDSALQTLERGLEVWPNDPDLSRKRAVILEAKLAWERQTKRAAAIDRLRLDAKARMDTGDLKGALALLEEGLRNWPDAQVLREMRDAAVLEAERRKERQRALRKLEEVKILALRISESAEAAKLASLAVSIASKYPDDEEVQAAAAEPIALVSDIGRARNELLGQNFQTAIDICGRYLEKHPDHIVFTELKREAERAQRRTRVDEFYRRAAAEPDLQKRAALLATLLEQYPDEPGIRDELRLTRNKLGLIDSIVRRARGCEQSGQWAEALEQWSSLLTIYEGYPGLAAEIDRVRRAEALVAEAALLPPGYNPPEAIRGAIADYKRLAAEEEPKPERAEPASTTQTDIANLDPSKRRRKRTPLLLAIGTAVALLSAVFIIGVFRRPGEIAVNIAANVSGAAVSVGPLNCVTPNCALKLAAGTYSLKASANGHHAVTQQITIAPRQLPLNLRIELDPLPSLIQVNTNFEGGKVYLDGRLDGALNDGRYTASGMKPGLHTIRVAGSDAKFEAEWRIGAGSPPELQRLTTGKDVQATIVASSGASGSIACNCVDQPVSIDGTPTAKTASSAGAPVSLNGLKQGAHQIVVGDRSVVVDFGANPALNVVLALDRNVGLLIVNASEDGAKIFLNNRLYRRPTEHGTLRIPVEAGDYSVRVEKDGFVSPEARILTLKKAEEKLVTFALTPAQAHLEITGSIAGTQVKLDGGVIGETDRNGGFRSSVTPGRHTVELNKDDYTPVRVSDQFAAGKVLQVGRGQTALVKMPKNAPPDARQVEAQEWAQIASSPNPEDFDNFIRNHPDGAHLEQARNRAGELRQLSQANMARQLEQAAWSKIDQNNREQLQSHLSRFPSGIHAAEIRTRIADLDQRSAEALAAQRLREQKGAEQARNAADESAVAKVLNDFEAAYNRKDVAALQQLWEGLPVASYRQQFREATMLKFQLQMVGQPVVNGNSATVTCTRALLYQGRFGGPHMNSERVRVTLSREGSGWRIRSIQAN